MQTPDSTVEELISDFKEFLKEASDKNAGIAAYLTDERGNQIKGAFRSEFIWMSTNKESIKELNHIFNIYVN